MQDFGGGVVFGEPGCAGVVFFVYFCFCFGVGGDSGGVGFVVLGACCILGFVLGEVGSCAGVVCFPTVEVGVSSIALHALRVLFSSSNTNTGNWSVGNVGHLRSTPRHEG